MAAARRQSLPTWLLPWLILALASLSGAGVIAAEDLANLPSFNYSAKNITVFVGDTARLICSVNNLQQRSVVWSRMDAEYPLTVKTRVYTNDRRIKLDHQEDLPQWTLVIEGVRTADAGIYSCQITTRTVHLEFTVELFVLERPIVKLPAVTLGETNAIAIGKGMPFSLQCNATATEDLLPEAMQMPPEIEWFKDGHKVNSAASSGILITNQIVGRLRISMLFVDKSAMEDGGMYLCRTSEQTFAEMRVHILNTDKDNKKRGTVLDKPTSDKLTASRLKGHVTRLESWSSASLLLIACAVRWLTANSVLVEDSA